MVIIDQQKPVKIFREHKKEVCSVDWCQNSTDDFILSASWDCSVKLVCERSEYPSIIESKKKNKNQTTSITIDGVKALIINEMWIQCGVMCFSGIRTSIVRWRHTGDTTGWFTKRNGPLSWPRVLRQFRVNLFWYFILAFFLINCISHTWSIEPSVCL